VVVSVSACAPIRGAAPVDPAPASSADGWRSLEELWRAMDEAEQARPAAEVAIGCVSHPAIDAWEERLRAGGAAWAATVHGVANGAQYLERVRGILDEEGVPASLALLPVIESSFQPQALAPDGGRGLWQLRARTARRFGLIVSRRRDERVDLERATRAAARYLRTLHDRYEDWPLALAAYNAGEGRVDRALTRLPGSSFWELAEERHLPAISRDYVPRFLAVVRVIEAERGC
jgi:membrane-bound lytic murein transglycosylase D